MSHFIELTETEMYVVDGGDFWETVGYIGGSIASVEISKACCAVLGANTVEAASAAAITAIAAVALGCVGFAAVGTVLAGTAIIEATT